MMNTRWLALVLSLIASSALAQTHGTWDVTNPWERAEGGPLRSTYEATGLYERLIDSNDVQSNLDDGTAATDGFCWYSDGIGGTEWAVCTGSGAAITSGTTDPSGGSDGDAYVEVDTSSVIQSIWLRASGAWTEYTLPAGGAGTGDITAVTGRHGISQSGDGQSGDVELDLDIASGTVGFVTTLAGGDDFVVSSTANSDSTRRISYQNLSIEIRDDIVVGDLPASNALDTEIISGALQPGNLVAGDRITITTATDGATIAAEGNYRGDWGATEIYARGEVTHNSSVYWVRNSTTGGSGGTPGNTNTDWYRIVGVETDQSTITGSGLSGNAIGVPNNGIAYAQMSNDSVGLAELRDDATELLCPDPSGGTAGQVCAVNTGATAYALVDQTGGGVGTDDQTAAEVSASVTNFDGRLSAADNDVQAALETLDDIDASGIPLVTTDFDGNLGAADNDVQAAFEALDDLAISTGTDDQTASEVPVTASGFDGNLATTDDTVQKVAQKFDDLITSVTATSAIVYKAHLEDSTLTDAESADWHEVMEINEGTDDIEFNDGPFTHTTHLDGHELVCVPVGQPGYYEIESDIVLRQSGSAVNRVTYVVRYTIRAEGTTTDTGQLERGFEYNRGIDANNSISSFELAVIYDLNGGDCIGVQVKTFDADEGDTNLVEFGYTVIGDDSFIEIVKHGGIAGAVGPTGPAGLDGTGADNQTAAEVTVSTTNFGVNLSATDDSVQEALDTLDDLISGGTGDITAVTTASNSGLAGGANTGAVALVVNLPGLPNSSSIVSTGTLAGATGGGSSVEYSVGAVSAYVQAQAVTDTALNATSALEAQSVAPSRQVVAELRDTLSANMGAALSDDLPVNIGPQSQQGTGDEASRDDHTHYLPHDTTLAFTTGTLGVDIGDVVEHLSERIQYYTEEADYSTGGSAAGQVYNTSRYPKNLQWVKAHLRVPTGVSDAIYRAGVYIVDETRNITAVLGQSDTSGIVTGTITHRFDFLAEDTSTLGIPLEGGERIEVLIRRIGAGNTADTGLIRGSEHSDSPTDSYIDAENDFVLVNHVVIERENPAVGDGTDFHGEAIRGNLQLGYTITIDHGSLVGDLSNVDPEHINSGASPRTDALYADGSGLTEFRPAHPRPTAMWYGEGQTGQHNAPSVKTFLANRYYRLTYESNSPDRHYEGGNATGVLVLDSDAATDYDLITRDSAAELRGDKKVIQFTPGRYRFKTRVWSSAATVLNVALFVFRSIDGDDTLAWVAAGNYSDVVNDPLGIGTTV